MREFKVCRATRSASQPLASSCNLIISVTHNLKLDPLAIELNGPDLEVDADGGDEGRCPSIITESEQET